MRTARRLRHVTPTEYLEGELTAEVKQEYVDGEVYEMVGASRAHISIVGNLHVALRQLIKRPCQLFFADLKVRVAAANAYFYPDLVVTCEPGAADPYVTEEPLIVVEVLCPSTEKLDRREKLRLYKLVPSIHEIVLVSQEERLVEVYRRDGDEWVVETAQDQGAVELSSLKAALTLGQIYADLP